MTDARSLFKIRLGKETKVRARVLMDSHSSRTNVRAIRGNATWVGWLGRVVLMEFFERKKQKVSLIKEGEEFFVKINEQLFQVKTATRRTLTDPQEEWSCLIELVNWEKWEKHSSRLFFIYYYEEYGVMWLLGYLDRARFARRSKIYKEGERFEKLITKKDLISVKLKNLVKFREMLVEFGILRRANIEKLLPKLRKIYRKYSRRIYNKQGEIEDYAFKKRLGQDPSAFKTNSQHLKAAQQYAEMIRQELDDPDLTDDDIVPTGTIQSFIKSDGGDGVVALELAKMENVSNKKYQAGLWGTMQQLWSLFNVGIDKLEYDPKKVKSGKVLSYVPASGKFDALGDKKVDAKSIEILPTETQLAKIENPPETESEPTAADLDFHRDYSFATGGSVVDLFCGCGGFSCGFEMAGFVTICGVELVQHVILVFHKNFPLAKFIERDIRKVKPEEIPDADVIIGGFPCQGFSIAGKRNILDERNSLYKEMIRILVAKKPKVFVGENVPGILSLKHPDGRTAIVIIEEELREALPEYHIHITKLKQLYFGGATKRERIFIIGSRIGIPYTPKPLRDEPLTVWDVIKDCPNNEDFKSAPKTKKWLKENKEFKVPYNPRFKQNKFRLHPDELAPTFVTDVGHSMGFFHPYEDRKLNVMEYQLLQSFPKDWKWGGTSSGRIGTMIANAVPPAMAKGIALMIKDLLDNEAVSPRKEHSFSEVRQQPDLPKVTAGLLSHLTRGHYRTIYADFPWSYSDKGSRIAPEKSVHGYQTMSLEDLWKLCAEVKEIAAEQSHLWFWTTKDFRGVAEDMVKACGFEFKAEFIWVKGRIDEKKGLVRHIGMGHWNRNMHEYLLLGVRGNLKARNAAREHSVILAPKSKHSAKPEEFYELIERNSPEPRIELFARKKRKGWDVFGDQVE